MMGRVGPRNLTPSLSQNRTWASQLIRLPSGEHAGYKLNGLFVACIEFILLSSCFADATA
jgi:hypothetical protein